jgi:YVTN family beta-propeller protein
MNLRCLLIPLVAVAASAQSATPILYFTPFAESSLVSSGGADWKALAGVYSQDVKLSPDGTVAYIASTDAGRIPAFSTATGKQTGTLQADAGPVSLAVSPDGSRVYAVNKTSVTLSVADSATGDEIGSVPLEALGILDLVVSPDGSTLYVSTGESVLIIDSASLSVVDSIPVQEAVALALGPSGNLLYVVTTGKYLLRVIDTATKEFAGSMKAPGGLTPSSVAVNPDGQAVYIGTQTGVTVVSTATLTITGRLQGGAVTKVVVSPDGSRALAGADGGNGPSQRIVYNLKTESILSKTNLPGYPSGCAISPDGETYYVLLAQTFVVDAFDTSTQQVQTVITDPENGILTASSSGNAVVAMNTDAVAAISTSTNTVGEAVSIPNTERNLLVAVNSVGTQAFAVVGSTAEIAMIDLVHGVVQQTITVPGAGAVDGFMYLQISPDDSTLYALLGPPADSSPAQICAVDIASGMVRNCATVPTSATPDGTYGPRPIAISPDGTKLYLQPSPSEVAEIDSTSFALLRTLTYTSPDSSSYAYSFAYSSANSSIYVLVSVNSAESQVIRVDLGTFSLAAQSTVNYQASDIAITPDGTKLYIAALGLAVADGMTLANLTTLFPSDFIFSVVMAVPPSAP